VFVVGYLGDWRRAAAVLFERESLSGHPAPSREAGQKAAPTVTQGAPFSRTGNQRVEAEAIVDQWPAQIASTLNASFGSKQGLEDQHINGGAPLFVSTTKTLPIAFGAQNSASQGDSVSTEVTPTLDKSKTPAVVYDTTNITSPTNGSNPKIGDPVYTLASGQHPPLLTTLAVCAPLNTQLGLRGADTSNSSREGVGIGKEGDPSFTLQAAHSHAIITPAAVRRLTPTECERLQGFPDDFTQIPWRNKPAEDCPDGPRYKAMGNSMAVPVMRWIGERIQMVESLDD
jgi:DNA (cytosine-5)-methyltransferase 1